MLLHCNITAARDGERGLPQFTAPVHHPYKYFKSEYNPSSSPPPLLLLLLSFVFFFFFLFFFFFFFFLSSSSFLLPFLFLLCKQANEFLLIYTVMKIQAVENMWKILTVYLTVICPLHQTIYQSDSTKGFWLTAERTFPCLNPPPPCFNNG